jgi:hypothetical protein
LTDELRAIGHEARSQANLPPIDVDREHAAFLDYWHAKAGKDACKVDWLATWRGWCRRSNAGTGRNGRAFGEGMRNQIADGMEAARHLDQIENEKEGRLWPAPQSLPQP